MLPHTPLPSFEGRCPPGTATGGLILPLVLPKMIAAYGPAKSLRILSIAIACCMVPLLPFLKGRLPPTRVNRPVSRANYRSWPKNKSLLFLMLVNTLQGFGYFVPILWLPSTRIVSSSPIFGSFDSMLCTAFASDLHLNNSNSSLTLAAVNGMNYAPA